MINEKKVKRFCKDYTKIENYEEAVKDTTQTWHCHHILGEILSRQQLKDHDFYYDVPPCMLKFVTGAEHKSLHMKGKQYSEVTRRKLSEAHKGKPSPRKGVTLSEETRRKMSEARKGKKHKPFTEETRRKLSEARKGHTVTEETRRKMSEAKKCKTWKLIDGTRVWLTKEV